MAFCPHCDIPYDEDNETQPCCGGCGHPITCGCSGHSFAPPSRPSWSPPYIPESSHGDEDSGTGGEPMSGDAIEVDDDLPF
jgi:hypothetical protein